MKKFFSFVAAALVAMTMNAQAISVADAITEGMKLDSMATSEAVYTVEGYVINAYSFSTQYMNQSWFMADAADATESDFEAYNCFPIEGNDTLKVLNGDKVSVTGKLKKYYNNNAKKYIIEIEKGNATFISKVDGDHTVQTGVEVITIAEALEIGNELASGAATEKMYQLTGVITALTNNKGVANEDGGYAQYNGSQNFWLAPEGSEATSNADGAFFVFAGVGEEQLYIGYKVSLTVSIKNYNGMIENGNSKPKVTILEKGDAPVVEYDTLNVTQAVAAAHALEDNTESAKPVVILGYVANIKTAYNDQYKNITFYMSDDATATYGDLQVYRGKISKEEGEALAQGDRVLVVGKLSHSVNNGKDYYEVAAGSEVSVLWKQSIEQIVLTEKVNKVLMDGVLYIVRDGKLFNLQGAQVR
ncbi:MAG: hypothetical protein IJV28_02305 [Paludibacteraceae bacterium]|nr:hypothetical protein [Paludibacteraceae bacterium]